MDNVVEAINELIKGINTAYSRGAYTMAESHDLHKAIEFIKKSASNTQRDDSDIYADENKDY